MNDCVAFVDGVAFVIRPRSYSHKAPVSVEVGGRRQSRLSSQSGHSASLPEVQPPTRHLAPRSVAHRHCAFTNIEAVLGTAVPQTFKRTEGCYPPLSTASMLALGISPRRRNFQPWARLPIRFVRVSTAGLYPTFGYRRLLLGALETTNIEAPWVLRLYQRDGSDPSNALASMLALCAHPAEVRPLSSCHPLPTVIRGMFGGGPALRTGTGVRPPTRKATDLRFQIPRRGRMTWLGNRLACWCWWKDSNLRRGASLQKAHALTD